MYTNKNPSSQAHYNENNIDLLLLFKDIQDCHHGRDLQYRNRTGLAILNLQASNQVKAQSDLRFVGRCGLKNFKMAAMAAILDVGTERF